MIIHVQCKYGLTSQIIKTNNSQSIIYSFKIKIITMSPGLCLHILKLICANFQAIISFIHQHESKIDELLTYGLHCTGHIPAIPPTPSSSAAANISADEVKWAGEGLCPPLLPPAALDWGFDDFGTGEDRLTFSIGVRGRWVENIRGTVPGSALHNTITPTY